MFFKIMQNLKNCRLIYWVKILNEPWDTIHHTAKK